MTDLRQGSDEWRQARCGSVGASDAPSVVRKIKSGGWSADRANLMADKLLERLTGVPVEPYKSPAMLRGAALEEEARLRYALQKNVKVEEVFLFPHPRIKGAHASPDGYVSTGGLVEIKCPLAAQHLDTILSQTIGNDHIVQMTWQLSCTGKPWCDYVSYNPDFPPAMQLWVKRVERDEARIRELEGEIAAFLRELEQKLDRLERAYARAA
jgi:putative phage-type endonuclease